MPDNAHSQLVQNELYLICQLSELLVASRLTIFSLDANNKSLLGFLCGIYLFFIYLFLREINMEKACRDFPRKG